MSISPGVATEFAPGASMICLRSITPPRHHGGRGPPDPGYGGPAGLREEPLQEARQRPIVHRLGQELRPSLVAPAVRDDRPAPELAEVHVRIVPVHRPG